MYRQPGFWILIAAIIAWVVWVGSCAPKSLNGVKEKLPTNVTQNFGG